MTGAAQSTTDTGRTRQTLQDLSGQLVRDAEPASKGNRAIYDTMLPGLGVSITSSVTIGKMRGRQLIVYDKRAEAIAAF